jgi:hypothetical protein
MSYCAHKVTEGFCLDCLRARVAELEAALRELCEWAESPPVLYVERMASVHGANYRPEDVAAWDRARSALSGAAQPRGEHE